MNNIQLHVGYIGITREGKRVEIESIDSSDDNYPWVTTCGDWYTDTGKFDGDCYCDKEDIIGPWVETPVEPQVNYNDGNWHGWNTGAMPVHAETLVTAIFDDGSGSSVTALACDYSWEVKGFSPVVFRVTKEYVAPVEPREFWITTGLVQIVRATKPHCPEGYIHVKEVTND